MKTKKTFLHDQLNRSAAQQALDKIKSARKGRKFKWVKISHNTWKEVEV